MQAYDAALGPRRPARTVIGYTLMLLIGLLGWGSGLALAGPTDFALALTLALLPVPLVLVAVLALDRLEPEPNRSLVLAFVWGATVAAVLAGIVNVIGISIAEQLLQSENSLGAYASIGAPVVEETLKGAVLLSFLIYRHQELDGPTDGIIYAAMVGLGFAFSENIEYYITAAAVGGGELTGTFVIRGVFCPLLHPLFTAMIGIAVGYAALRPRGPERIALVGAGVLGAMVLHGVWNGSASTSPGALLAVYLLIMFPALVCVVVVTRVDTRRILALRLRLLPQVTPAGMVTPELAWLLAEPARVKAARRRLTSDGRADAARALGDYQRAGTELVLAHHRLERGVVTREWVDQRRTVLLPVLDGARRAVILPPTW
ncbi:MAG: PrsW family intramembrane metalloprotease [Sporichthyaceae bacterium]